MAQDGSFFRVFLEPELHRRLRIMGAVTGVTMQDIVVRAIAQEVEKYEQEASNDTITRHTV